MNGKSKKSKHKKKLSDDLPDIHDYKKEIFKNDNNNNRQHRSDSDTKNQGIRSSRKRKHTKISHGSIENHLAEIVMADCQDYKGKKVRFSKIEVIEVESWKKINLKLTAEENLDELMKISQGKKERNKNVSCTCVII